MSIVNLLSFKVKIILFEAFLFQYFQVNCFRKLEDGDIVNVDVTVYYKGVHGKKVHTFSLNNLYITCKVPYLANG